MDKLLNWSIAQQSGDKEAIEKIGAPDPKVLSQLFGGPDEPALMKQSITVATNPEASDENKIVALENFEMLIENLDNANNIENIKLWPSVMGLLKHSNPEIRELAASIVGIAVQNNPQAQKACTSHGGVESLIELVKSNIDVKAVYYKGLFALSSLVRHDTEAYEMFAKHDGWSIISTGNDTKSRLRQLSLISSLLSTGLKGKEDYLHKDIIFELIQILTTEDHVGCIDKVLNVVSNLHSEGFKFSSSELELLTKGLAKVENRNDVSDEDIKAVRDMLK